jgi:rhodanese-related sulfurtransferase
MEDKSCKTPRWRQLKALLNNLPPIQFRAAIEHTSNAVIIDVRTHQEFLQGHICNAINVDFLSENLWEEIEQMDKNQTFFIYCRSGRRSIRVCTLMRNGGFDNTKVFNLDGGLVAWEEEMGVLSN